MEWEKLLSSETLRKRGETPAVWSNYPIDDFEKDYREVVTGVGFRNLQNTAQVFSRVESGIVRTRLTHSLEVSSVAKQLGIMVADNRRGTREDGSVSYGENSAVYASRFSMILACAGLLHDLGNPPFGHFGEASIGAWFKKSFSNPNFTYMDKQIRKMFSDQMKADLEKFDGNAQTIHLLLKDFENRNYDTNVSFAVLNTLVKYPGSSIEADSSSEDIRLHKFGYYASDEKRYKMIRSAVGLSGVERHPLTYLLEASDDISYLISDLQDSIAMGIVQPQDVLFALEEEINSMSKTGSEFYELQYMAATSMLNKLKSYMESSEDNDAGIAVWFNFVRDWLIYAAAHSWFKNYDAIMSGTFTGELMTDNWYAFVIKAIRKVMKKSVYPSLMVIENELMGHRIIEELLDRFIPSVFYFEAGFGEFSSGAVEMRYQWHIPEYLKKEYLGRRTGDEAFDLYLRFLMVVDYISGMTDSEAISLSEKI